MDTSAVAPRRDRWDLMMGPAITLAAAAVIEILTQTGYRIPTPPAILNLAIVFAAYRGGMGSGLVSTAIAWSYTAYFFSEAGHPFRYSDEDFDRLMLWAITMPATAVIVGILKGHLEATLKKAQESVVLQVTLDARSQAERKLLNVLESAPDAIVIANQKGAIDLVNRQTEMLFGYERKELVGQPVEILVPERFHTRHTGHRANYFGEPSVRPMGAGLELYARRKDGSEFPVEISLSPLDDEQGIVVVCSIRDVTERKQAENSLKGLAEELKAVSAQLAHAQEIERHRLSRELHDQIGQSLAGLDVNLNLIRGALSPDAAPNIGERLDDSLELVDAMTERVRDLMAALRPPMLDDYGVLAALRWHAELVSERTGLAIQVAGPELRLAAAAEIALFRIAQEALVNTIKHAKAAGVAITFAKEGEGLRLSIEDNGTGFQTSMPQRRTELRGWGLLTMRERAESVGGKLRVESAPGKGTKIIVEIAGGGDLWPSAF